MARYGGGHEDFDKALQATNELAGEVEKLAASEATYRESIGKTGKAEGDAARTAGTRARAKKEGTEVDERAARAAGRSADNIKVDTEAIKANTEARQRLTRQAAMGGRAVYGARSPQYGEAYRLMQEQGGLPSQYRLRQIPGVGQRRAVAMREAMQAGLVPAVPGAEAATRPLTRVTAAHERVAESDYAMAQANEEYTRVKRKGTEAETKAAYATREAAKLGVQSARSELVDAEKAQAAQLERGQLAMQREAEARDRVAAAHLRDERLLGQIHQAENARVAAIRSETLERARQGIGPSGQLALPAPGQTVQGMPVVPAQTRTAVPISPPDWVGGPGGRAQTAGGAKALAAEAEAMGDYARAATIYQTQLQGVDDAHMKALQTAALGARYADDHANAQMRVAQANREAGASFYPLSQAMHRHGALTSEFIAAAARGEVTLREMGNQAVITAGKFAGWTVAATAVYGVAGALGQVAQGAIDASSGTQQAYRVINQGVDPDALMGDFSNLSRTFNVPIDEAADAVYRMGQVFHNQEDAVKAAEAALIGYKTGGLSVEESTRNLIAIQNAFGLSASELTGIFDILNDAQNKFSANLPDIATGIAKAGGTWRQAGGDLEYLSALMTGITKATGRPGTEIGTALSRLYYVQHPESLQKLKDLGVDADTRDVQKTFESMVKQAQKPGADVIGLATAFAGGQYQRLITPVLREPERFEKAKEQLGFLQSAGSGARELDKILGQVDEQIAQIGHGFQRLGEALSRAGAFTVFGGMLKILNLSLTAAEQLVNWFNLIPNPFRQALVLIGQMTVALAVLRRLGATERLANTPFGYLADPAGRQRTHTIVGLRQGRQEAYNRLERFGAINVDRAFEADVRRQAVQRMRSQYQAVQGLDVMDPERQKVEAQWIAANRAARQAEAELALSTQRLDDARAVARRSEEQLTLAQNTGKRKFEAVAAKQGWPAVAQLDQPNTAGITAPGGLVAVGGAAGGRPEQTVRQGTQSMEAMTRRTQAMATAISGFTIRGQQLGVSQRGLSAAVTKAGPIMDRAGGFMRGAAGSMASLGRSMAGFAAALGPLEIAFIALGAYIFLKGESDKIQKQFDKTRQTLQGSTRNQAQVKAQEEAARKIQQEAAGKPDIALTQAAIAFPFLAPIALLTGSAEKTIRQWTRDFTGITQAAEDTAANIESRIALQARAKREGKARPLLTWDQLKTDIQRTSQDREKGQISQAEFDRLMALHATEAKHMLDADKGQVEAARRAMADAARKAHSKNYGQTLLDMPTDEFQKQMQGQAAAVELFGLTPHNMDFLKQQYAAAEAKFRRDDSPEALIALNTARNAYFSAIIGETQKELQFGLLSARSEGERRAAFTQANAQYKQARINIQQQAKQIRARQKKERDDQRREQKMEDYGGYRHQATTADDMRPGQGPAGTGPRLTDEQVRKREDRQRRERIKLTKKQRQDLDKELARQNRELDMAALQLKEQAYQDRQQGREILLNLQVAGTQDPLRQATLQIDSARRQVDDARTEWGTQSRQYRQALTGLRNAMTQRDQAILAGVQADNALLLARAGDDPVAQARAQVQAIDNELKAMRAAKADPNAIKTKEAERITARRAETKTRSQQAQDIARLQGELAAALAGGDPVLEAQAAIKAAALAKRAATTQVERLQADVDMAKALNQMHDALAQRAAALTDLQKSRTDDPVEQARLDMKAAADALKGSKGFDRIQKQTAYNNARRAWQQSKIDSRVDDINFQLGMDQITRDEAAKQLEALANMKGISKQKKRELLLQAKQLRDEGAGDYELDVGSIRLPSLYEVRRFVQAGQPNASQINTDNRTFTVYLGSAEAVNAFASQLEMTNGGAAKATARSMQMR